MRLWFAGLITYSEALTRAGVTDSKAFTGEGAHAERMALLPRILDAADHVAVMVIDVAEIDRRCRDHGMRST